MNSSPESPFQSARIEALGKALPVVAGGLGLTYGVGLLCSWIANSVLGVGDIGVSKERALAIGVVFFIVSSPYCVAFEYCKMLELSKTGREKLIAIFSGLLVTCLVSMAPLVFLMVAGAVSPHAGIGNTHMIAFVAYPAIFGVLAILTTSVQMIGRTQRSLKTAVSRYFWILVMPYMFSAICIPRLSSAFGGYYYNSVLVKLTDGSTVTGGLLIEDNTDFVLDIDGQFIQLPKANVKFIANLRDGKALRNTTLRNYK